MEPALEVADLESLLGTTTNPTAFHHGLEAI